MPRLHVTKCMKSQNMNVTQVLLGCRLALDDDEKTEEEYNVYLIFGACVVHVIIRVVRTLSCGCRSVSSLQAFYEVTFYHPIDSARRVYARRCTVHFTEDIAVASFLLTLLVRRKWCEMYALRCMFYFISNNSKIITIL